MSERRRDGAWIIAVAASRGIEIDPHRAEEIVSEVVPTFERFDELVTTLAADDDPAGLRRRLAAEGHG